MESLWIVHDEGPARAAIARLAGISPTWSGSVAAAGARIANQDAAPEVVILGLPGRLDDALASAGHIAREHPEVRWVLLHPRSADVALLERRFAAFDPTLLRWPPAAPSLRRALQQRPGATASEPALAGRRQREALVRRFSRSFGDLDLPSPMGDGSPLLIIGEPGTGRLLMARVVHALAERSSRFVHVACEAGSDLASLSQQLEALDGEPATLCLEHPESLSNALQRELRGWIELGPPNIGIDPDALRWIGLVDETAEAMLEPGLAQVLSSLEIRIPPLRQRPGTAGRFAEAWLDEWCHTHRAASRPLDAGALAALDGDAWPGNLRELEETLRRAASSPGDGAISASDLGIPAGTAPLAEAREALVAPSTRPAIEPVEAERAPETAERLAPAVEFRVPVLARALSHELRNPMVSLQTFAQLLPERGDDPSFQNEFRYQVERDLARIDGRLARLSEYGELRQAEAKPVNVCALVELLLDECRSVITERHLLVLRELEDERPEALGDPDRLRFAFSALLDAAFEAVADGADLYVACRHHPRGLDDGPAMRVLVRFHAEHAPLSMPGEAGELELSLLLARDTLEALGGKLTMDSTEADERVLLIDLPAPN